MRNPSRDHGLFQQARSLRPRNFPLRQNSGFRCAVTAVLLVSMSSVIGLDFSCFQPLFRSPRTRDVGHTAEATVARLQHAASLAGAEGTGDTTQPESTSRRGTLSSIVVASCAAVAGFFSFTRIAKADDSAQSRPKRRNLPATDMANIVREDLVQRQFLATANFTPEIYSDSCTFTDEIDTYTYDKFIKGTQALFVGDESKVDLVGDVDVLDEGKKLQFKFAEELAFNFGIIHPKVTLSGVCTLTRGDDGLITGYREKWDQSVPAVLATFHL
eukprot:TRINITY_DN59870_c0_g1_i1.p1 TRINITY_DN59870_c0_g1~~TRINITY_DN59870_c0_g1_i1.p1  ORF type:complete len:272 (+),score=32.82 TRINITY_DN59870_c0_g1_i1:50-865(+)